MDIKLPKGCGVLLLIVIVLMWIVFCGVMYVSGGGGIQGILVILVIYLLVDGFLGFQLAGMALAEILALFLFLWYNYILPYINLKQSPKRGRRRRKMEICLCGGLLFVYAGVMYGMYKLCAVSLEEDYRAELKDN